MNKTPWNKGKRNIYSAETIQKMRDNRKGQTAWNKGLKLSPLSEKHRRRISEGLEGRVSYWKGKHFSEEHRRKIKDSAKGRIPWNKGVPHSKEYRRKMSESHKGLNTWMKGRKLSEETKQKMRKKSFSADTRLKISLSHRGEKSYLWKGGITPINQQARVAFKIKEWRLMVFKRDNYACQICGIRGGILNAHHIEKFSENKELRAQLSNGITLCQSCHNRTKHREAEFAPLCRTILLNKVLPAKVLLAIA